MKDIEVPIATSDLVVRRIETPQVEDVAKRYGAGFIGLVGRCYGVGPAWRVLDRERTVGAAALTTFILCNVVACVAEVVAAVVVEKDEVSPEYKRDELCGKEK